MKERGDLEKGEVKEINFRGINSLDKGKLEDFRSVFFKKMKLIEYLKYLNF